MESYFTKRYTVDNMPLLYSLDVASNATRVDNAGWYRSLHLSLEGTAILVSSYAAIRLTLTRSDYSVKPTELERLVIA